MYRLVYSFSGGSPVAANYRGSEPIKHYAHRQRSIYKAARVEAFDENGALVFIAEPKKRQTEKPTLVAG
jgi:hypothetical protein